MIRLENLSKSFGSKLLFENVYYHFPICERIALVGTNGAGKSTLLNIISSLDHADSGVVLAPKQTTIAYLPQEPNPNPRKTVLLECQSGREDLLELKTQMDIILHANSDEKMNDLHTYETLETTYRNKGGYTLEARACRILNGLKFTTADFEKSPLELSGGWRMRLELAKLFLKEADFLILDEPTNHLDLPSLVWVEKFLTRYKGTLLFVSHDRELLNRLPTLVLHLSSAGLKDYKGNYDAFLRQKEAILNQEKASLEQIKKKKDQLESFVTRFGAKATKAKQAQSKMKQIDRLAQEEKSFEIHEDESAITIKLPEPKRSPKIPLVFTKGSIGYSSPLAQGIELQVERGNKIAIIGANGIGKSTLVKTLAGKISALSGEIKIPEQVLISYFSQDQLDTIDEKKSVIDNLLAVSADLGQGEARSILGAFLFQNDDVFKQVKVLSGGEKGRLGLARVLVQNANLLLLDEPTNHLDMNSVEALIRAIKHYTGTVVFVSHDRSFINACCSHIFAMLPDGRSMLFAGNLSDYERLSKIAGFPNVLESEEGDSTNTFDKANTSEKSLAKKPSSSDYKKLTKSVEKLKKSLHQDNQLVDNLNKKLTEIDQRLLSIDPSAFDEINNLHQTRQLIQSELEEVEVRWLQNMEELENQQEQLSNHY
ncbi:MAG: ABC-F family ATP-binding cassette domain-containing protein [Bdellovibrionota bacterium]